MARHIARMIFIRGDISLRMRYVAANPTSASSATLRYLASWNSYITADQGLEERGLPLRWCGQALALKACEGNNSLNNIEWPVDTAAII
jgi:hypothetical protein